MGNPEPDKGAQHVHHPARAHPRADPDARAHS
jgi:hypothetical protein